MIAIRSTAFDHIELNYCSKHNIVVSNVPAYAEETVANKYSTTYCWQSAIALPGQ